MSHTPTDPTRIFALDPTTKGFGYAILETPFRLVDWGLARRLISRCGSLFARIVLGLSPNDLTGGFKAWRATTLAAIPFDGIHAGGYVFQIETTFRASRAGARIREVPITFQERRVGQSKMSRRIIVEAFVVVVQLRLEELTSRWRERRQPT